VLPLRLGRCWEVEEGLGGSKQILVCSLEGMGA
jgi:hypothetical protein